MPNLYVTEPGAMVEKEYERLLVTRKGEVLLDVPLIKVEAVVLVGPVGITTPALAALLDRGIGLALLSEAGELRGRLVGDRLTSPDLRRAQYSRSADAAFCQEVARACVRAKLHNSRVFCLRWARDGVDGAAEAAARLETLEEVASTARDLPHLLGVEAEGARAYFGAFRAKLRPGWEFPRRARRPPPDPVNALLGAAYTLLGEAIHAAVTLVGLDPACGFYHRERPGRPALVLDLMEEFRALIADSVVLSLINRRVLGPEDFRPGVPERPVLLAPRGFRALLVEFGERLRTPVLAPGAPRHLSYQKLFEVQARRLAAAITGRAAAYEGYRTR